jgi:hypothetical protein
MMLLDERTRFFEASSCGSIAPDDGLGDVRYFLQSPAGARSEPVLRRISRFEERLGTQMFEKLPSGYRLTNTGEGVLEFAE